MIIGVVGTFASGKDTAANYIESRGFVHVSSGDVLRQYIRDHNLGGLDRDNLRVVANRTRAEKGADFFIRQAIRDATSNLVISGIRSSGEAEAVKKAHGMIIAVDAPINKRYEWASGRGRIDDSITPEKFKEQEMAEESDKATDQQITVVMGMADFDIANDGTLEELYAKIDEVLERIMPKDSAQRSSSMLVVGLTGGMGQGKSTVGEMLRGLAEVDYRADLETSYPITEVANAWMAVWPHPLKLKPGQTMVELANELIDTFPPVLKQVTGKQTTAQALRISEDASSLEMHNRLLKYLDPWVLLSEAERKVQLPTPIDPENKGLHRSLLMWIGGVMITLVSPTIWSDLLDHRIKQLAGRGYALVTVGGIRYPHDAAMIHANNGLVLRVLRPDSHKSDDVTETSMKDIQPDVELYNDGSLEQLEKTVHNLWVDLKADSVKPKYRA